MPNPPPNLQRAINSGAVKGKKVTNGRGNGVNRNIGNGNSQKLSLVGKAGRARKPNDATNKNCDDVVVRRMPPATVAPPCPQETRLIEDDNVIKCVAEKQHTRNAQRPQGKECGGTVRHGNGHHPRIHSGKRERFGNDISGDIDAEDDVNHEDDEDDLEDNGNDNDDDEKEDDNRGYYDDEDDANMEPHQAEEENEPHRRTSNSFQSNQAESMNRQLVTPNAAVGTMNVNTFIENEHAQLIDVSMKKRLEVMRQYVRESVFKNVKFVNSEIENDWELSYYAGAIMKKMKIESVIQKTWWDQYKGYATKELNTRRATVNGAIKNAFFGKRKALTKVCVVCAVYHDVSFSSKQTNANLFVNRNVQERNAAPSI